MFLQNSLMVQTKARVLLSVLWPTWEQAVFMQFWQEKRVPMNRSCVFTLCRHISSSQPTWWSAALRDRELNVSVFTRIRKLDTRAQGKPHAISMYEHVWASAVWDAVVQGLVLNAAYFKAHSEASASTSSSSRLLFVRLSHERSHQTSPTTMEIRHFRSCLLKQSRSGKRN